MVLLEAHPRDERVSFDAETHTYSIDGSSEGVTSVTTLLSEYFPKFDADAVIDKYHTRWQQNPFKKPECYGKTEEEIKEMWKSKGEEAAQEGRNLHGAIEAFYNREPIDYDTARIEWKQYQAFEEEHQLRDCDVRAEMILWSSEHKLGGMIDLVVKNKDGTYSLYDWKRCKDKINRNAASWGRTGSGPFRNLPDTKFHRFSVQLNLYRELLERYYGYTVSSMHVVRFHPDAKGFEVTKIERMTTETNALLELRRRDVSEGQDEIESVVAGLASLAVEA